MNMTLQLCDARFESIVDDERLVFVDMWKNRSTFFEKIIYLICEGLDKTEEDA